jgi:hypothetical protein
MTSRNGVAESTAYVMQSSRMFRMDTGLNASTHETTLPSAQGLQMLHRLCSSGVCGALSMPSSLQS